MPVMWPQGDVLVHLIETAHEELSKPTRVFSTTRLQVGPGRGCVWVT